MRAFLPFVLSVVLLSSCSRYQCLVISSEKASVNTSNEFVTKTDSFDIGCSFHNQFGTIQVAVFNKSGRGLRMDWARSFVIIGGNPSAFWTPDVRISGELEQNSGTISHSINAVTSQPEAIQFIPPQSIIRRNGLSLTRDRFMATNSYVFYSERIATGKFDNKIKRAKFQKDNSPLTFRVYLTVLPENAEAVTLEEAFFISDIIKTRANAFELFPKSRHKNMIVMHRTTLTGSLLWLGGIVGVAALLAS